MKFKDFSGTGSACDIIYNDPSYDDAFFVETKEGERFKVSLTWEQGRVNNYRFIRGGETIGYNNQDIIWPSSVTKIEIK